MTINRKDIVAAVKSATAAVKPEFSTSPRKGGKMHCAVKIPASPTSRIECEELCATNEMFKGWSFFTSRDGSTHGVFAIVDAE